MANYKSEGISSQKYKVIDLNIKKIQDEIAKVLNKSSEKEIGSMFPLKKTNYQISQTNINRNDQQSIVESNNSSSRNQNSQELLNSGKDKYFVSSEEDNRLNTKESGMDTIRINSKLLIDDTSKMNNLEEIWVTEEYQEDQQNEQSHKYIVRNKMGFMQKLNSYRNKVNSMNRIVNSQDVINEINSSVESNENIS